MSELDAALREFESRLGIEAAKLQPKNLTCLMVVDDDPGFLRSLVDTLSGDYEVIACPSGQEALQRLDARICTIILDIKMPGMSGLEVIKEIKKRLPDLPVIFNTGYPGEYMEAHIEKEYEPFGYVTKDNPQILMAHLKSAVKHFNLTQSYRELIENLEKKVEERTRDLKESQAQLVQAEKMAALGTLTAGIAHEINNPIVAVDRGVDQLQEKLKSLAELSRKLKTLGIQEEDSAQFDSLFVNTLFRSIERQPISTTEARVLSERLETLFRTHKVVIDQDAIKRLASIGIDEEPVQPILRLMVKYGPSLISEIIYIHGGIGTIVRNMKIGAARIGTIVSALKGFSHLDRAPFKEYSVHDGIESTLVILHNLIKYGITIEKNYCKNLPLIQAYPGELNQVWMNILHNAVHAAEGSGKIRIETFIRNELVVVKISDNGPGIPDEVLPKIFEPFFTTKDQGQGTGLGLNIAYKIIEKHQGQIHVKSRLGEGTAFEVLLPINLSLNGAV